MKIKEALFCALLMSIAIGMAVLVTVYMIARINAGAFR